MKKVLLILGIVVIVANILFAGTITGNVKNNLGQNLAGVTVDAFVLPAWSPMESVTTNINGDYTVTLNTDGNYYLRAGNGTLNYQVQYYNGVNSFDSAQMTSINIISSTVTGGMNFSLVGLTTITGNIRDSGNNILPWALVEIFGPAWAWQASVTTDSQGDYIARVVSGSYKVRASTGNYISQLYGSTVATSWNDSQTINVSVEAPTGNINFSLTLGGAISGNITNRLVQALSGIKVEFVSITGNYINETTSLGDGSFLFRGLPTGSIKARASASLYPLKYFASNNSNASSLESGETILISLDTVSTNINFVMDSSNDITNFVCLAGDSQVTLNWSNPSNLNSIVIRRSAVAYPTSVSSGDQVYSATSGFVSSISNTELINGTLYYYSIFATANTTINSIKYDNIIPVTGNIWTLAYPNPQTYPKTTNWYWQMKNGWAGWVSRNINAYGDDLVHDPYANGDAYSEGVGYGLLLSVLMNDQPTFNRILSAADVLLNANSNGLYAWKANSAGTVVSPDAATDADQDIALALIFADILQRQGNWTTTTSYKTRAQTLINNIYDHEVTKNMYLLSGDSWSFTNTADIVMNPSYFAPAWYRIFDLYEDTDHDWNSVINQVYSTLKANPGYWAGLAPDWCKPDGTEVSGKSYESTYDAIRTLWRFGLDAIWFDNADAKEYAGKAASFIDPVSANLYKLDGNIAIDQHTELTVAMWAAGVMGSSNDAKIASYNLEMSLFDNYVNISSNREFGNYEGAGRYYFNQSLSLFGIAVLSGAFANVYNDLNVTPNTVLTGNVPTTITDGFTTINAVYSDLDGHGDIGTVNLIIKNITTGETLTLNFVEGNSSGTSNLEGTTGTYISSANYEYSISGSTINVIWSFKLKNNWDSGILNYGVGVSDEHNHVLTSVMDSSTQSVYLGLATITGSVTNSSGNSVADVNIDVFGNSWNNYITGVTTNASGVYSFKVVSGSYKIRANYGNYVAELYGAAVASPWELGSTVDVSAGSILTGINFQLIMGGGISGNITDVSGNIISGAKVEIVSVTGNYITEAVSSTNGSYLIQGIPTGAIKIRASTTNFELTYSPSSNSVELGVTITILENIVTGNIGISLNPIVNGLITGSVTNVLGNPLSNAVIDVFGTGWDKYITGVTTNTTGYYSISLAPGSYKIRVSTGNYVSQLYGYSTATSWNAATTINITSGSSSGNINFNLIMGGRISGTVFDSVNNGLAGAKVEIVDSTGEYITETTTSTNGTYDIRGIPTGTVKVRATTLNITRFYKNMLNLDNAWPIILLEDEHVSGIDFQMVTGSTYASLNISITTPSSLIRDTRSFTLEGTISYMLVPTINVFNLSAGNMIVASISGNLWTTPPSPSVYLITGNNNLLVYAQDASGNISTATITIKWIQATKTVRDNNIGTTVNVEVTPGAYPTSSVLSVSLVASSNVSSSAGASPTGTSFVLAVDITVSPSITNLSASLSVTIEIPNSISTANISLYYWDVSQNIWSTVGLSNISLSGRLLSFTTNHLSRFAVMSGIANTSPPLITFTPIYDAIDNQSVTISVTVSDEASINSVVLYYGDNSTQNNLITMSASALVTSVNSSVSGVFAGIIPVSALSSTTNLVYYLKAFDGVYTTQTPTYAIRVKSVSSTNFTITELINYPNPFGSGGTTFYYVLSQDADVNIKVFTTRGELVKSFTASSGQAGGQLGVNRIPWDGQNDFAEPVANGVYLYLIVAKNSIGKEISKKGKSAVLR